MKVQFIFPNFGCPIGISMGVAILSSELKKSGHETSCIHINDDLGYSYDLSKIMKDVECYGPDLIAFSFGTNHLVEVKEIAEHLKQSFKIPIIFGGIHSTLNAEDMIFLDYVDIVCVGEGEDAIVELANALEKSHKLTSISNLWVKKNGSIIKNRIRPLKDISEQAIMDTDIWDFQKITDLRNGWVNVIAGRGCPFRCTYCHNDGVVKLFKEELKGSLKEIKYNRRRSVKNLISELKLLKQKYSIKAFSFNDDCFTHDKPWILDFLQAYKSQIGMPFVCNTHAIFMDDEIAKALAEANCDMVRFGVESGSKDIRKKILGRPMSNKIILDALKSVRRAGIRTFTYNMMGIPTESIENMLSTLEFNALLNPDGLRVSLAYPYPGTTLYDVGKEMDIIEDVEYHDYLEKTKFNYSDDFKQLIDRIRVVYWWHINKHLNNGASGIYEALLNSVENIPKHKWSDKDTNSILLNIDRATSELLTKMKVSHYVAKYQHRPDIAILVQGDDFIQEELLDQH